MRKLIAAIAMVFLGFGVVEGQTCPSSCDTITSGSQTFCRCLIHRSSDTLDRMQLVTDEPLTIVDVNGDGLRDIPFGIWASGRIGAYVLLQSDSGIPGNFTEVKISDTSTYGITAIGDINGDGILDFATTTHWSGHKALILTSPGYVGPYNESLLFYDYDAIPNSITSTRDLVFFTDYAGALTYYNLRDSSLTRLLDSTNRYCGDGIAIGDFNGDGYTDAACSNYSGSPSSSFNGLVVHYIRPFLGTPPEVISTEPFQGIVAYDFDDDGAPDIAAAGEKVSIFYNERGSWTEVVLDSNFAYSSFGIPFSRVNIMDIDCDGDVDIVAATSCPTGDGATLVWYENVDMRARTWERHPIEFGGNNCSGGRPYPYGLRVGLLDERDTLGRGDIVIVWNASNELWAYYNVSTDAPECKILGEDDELAVSERRSFSRDETVSVFSADGRRIFHGRFSDVPSLGPGVYFVVGRGHVEKVVVK
ncbi:MAG: VCBS repeat-containing protein [Thermotogae bacterium]|nr:VCBS repeat-containing protein [Thermotogota bacterium]